MSSSNNFISAPITSNHSYRNVPNFEDRNQLGKDAFLRILVTQLQNQDPLEPLQDREFISQMTQFSSLEQITNLSKSLTRFVDFQMSGSIAQQSHLIGQKVHWERVIDGMSFKGQGIVKALSMKNGELTIELDNNHKISLADIHRIERAELVSSQQSSNSSESTSQTNQTE